MIRKWIYMPILGIIIGELFIFEKSILVGFIIHLINLLLIVFLIIFGRLEMHIKNILQALILVTLLRVIGLSMPLVVISTSMPQFFNINILQYFLVYGIMFVPISSAVKNQRISVQELGISLERFYIYIPLAVLIGIIMAIIENRVIHPIALIVNFNFSNIATIIILMVLFIGTVEEIIFRSILQTRLKQVFGWKYGIFASGILFGMMHSTYGIIGEILLANIYGIVLGYIFHKTRNLTFTISIHASTNVILFGILPLLK